MWTYSRPSTEAHCMNSPEMSDFDQYLLMYVHDIYSIHVLVKRYSFLSQLSARYHSFALNVFLLTQHAYTYSSPDSLRFFCAQNICALEQQQDCAHRHAVHCFRESHALDTLKLMVDESVRLWSQHLSVFVLLSFLLHMVGTLPLLFAHIHSTFAVTNNAIPEIPGLPGCSWSSSGVLYFMSFIFLFVFQLGTLPGTGRVDCTCELTEALFRTCRPHNHSCHTELAVGQRPSARHPGEA
jgi:hypothetical protein